MTHTLQCTPRRAVYAGSFDPTTNGQLWMIAEAAQLFDELIVAIGVNPDKKASYQVEERQAMLQAIVAPFANVRVDSFTNQFLVNYAHSVNAEFIIRGIRTATDYEYERAIRRLAARHPHRFPDAAARNRRNLVHLRQRTGGPGRLATRPAALRPARRVRQNHRRPRRRRRIINTPFNVQAAFARPESSLHPFT